jgi:formamidopyrimidine-DNA glycosylase
MVLNNYTRYLYEIRNFLVPELPEIETVCRGLRPFLENYSIQNVQINRPNLRYPFPPLFKERLEGAKIIKIERRAKYILIHLDNELTWVIHLGMSGRIRINEETVNKHDHVIWTTEQYCHFVYNDPRRFGLMDLVRTRDLDQHRLFTNLGIDPFDAELTPELLHKFLSKNARPLKSVLLDQTIIVGLGNIYVCEALWLTNLSPFRNANTLSLKQCNELLENVLCVLKKAINAGGSTLKDYSQPNGELGYFQHQFKAYGREGKECLTESCNGSIKRIVQSGRSTFYCSVCSF